MSADTNPTSRSPLPVFLAGLIGLGLGAVVVAAIFWVLMLRQQARHEAEMAAVAGNAANIADIRNIGQVPMFDMREGEDAKVKRFGSEFIEDLENNRLQSAYRSMGPEFQKNIKRAEFDEMVAENPAVRSLIGYDRIEKVRKGPDGKNYEYYMTALERGTGSGMNKVNFALVIEKFNDEWRVTELEITADSKPKKK